eukprot:CAMPEP_0113547742 /NCGR_PEP_ID=MMETSP0015_2-20120614/12521_1 /TAXON_ID=2838 /ORGANISM="Odontella" /LENGTH=140 /DNA_ID=CAMNT_0000448323 /DNA_START=107 /DNA_END=525 /DNA_ORIENTATION=- /assembly_acc=CAM_ASM_000160
MIRSLFVAFSGVASRVPPGGGRSTIRPRPWWPSRLSGAGASTTALKSTSRSRSLSFYSTPPELRPVTADAGDLRFPSHQYNRVERIILVRHGESLGNIDETSYGRLADWRIPLTDAGKEQARAAGRTIRGLMESGSPESG